MKHPRRTCSKPVRPLALVVVLGLGACAGTASRPLDPRPGAAGIGDPYYAELGNGGYDVQHYDLRLEVDMDSGVIEALATVTAVALHDLSRFNLDLYGLDVDAVTVDGRDVEFDREEQELIITPSGPIREGAEFVVAVAYGGVPEVVPDPAIPFVPGVGWWRTPSGVYVLSECSGAQSWFPCNDHPLDKATFSVSVTVAKPYVVASNGLLVGEEDHGDSRTYRWRASDPMATYLATVDIAEFDVIVAEGPGGIPLRTYCPTDATEDELAEFARTPEMIEFFAERFGPYPFESYGAIISYERLGGALETQTIPVYSRGASEGTLAHELAHQWFGDCVSPAAWRDLWLNEGFAVFAGSLWREHVDATAAAERAFQTYSMLRTGEVDSPADPGLDHLFSRSVYVRGSWVLHCLRAEVGDPTLFEILRTWVAAHHDGNGSTEGFVDHASEVAGRDLDAFFQGVLFDPVIPEIAEYEEVIRAMAAEEGSEADDPAHDPVEATTAEDD